MQVVRDGSVDVGERYGWESIVQVFRGFTALEATKDDFERHARAANTSDPVFIQL